jgi:nitrogen-specific signal transduction histidine kinase
MARLVAMHDELVHMRDAVQRAAGEAAHLRTRYFALLDFFEEPVLVVAGAELRIEHANAAAATLLNLSVSSLPGRHLLSFFAADRPAIQAAVQHATAWPVRLTALIRPRERRSVSVALRVQPCDEAECLFLHISPAAEELLPVMPPLVRD